MPSLEKSGVDGGAHFHQAIALCTADWGDFFFFFIFSLEIADFGRRVSVWRVFGGNVSVN